MSIKIYKKHEIISKIPLSFFQNHAILTEMTTHALPIRIYYEDTDAGGVVYHANYIKFAERGRTEFLRSLGHQNSDLEKTYGTLFLVKQVDIQYFKPAFLDDLLQLDTAIVWMKNSSFQMRQLFTKAGEIIAEMHVTLVCVQANTIKPYRIPDVIRTEFEKFTLTVKKERTDA